MMTIENVQMLTFSKRKNCPLLRTNGLGGTWFGGPQTEVKITIGLPQRGKVSLSKCLQMTPGFLDLFPNSYANVEY